jgi:hypothetical protein
MACRSCQSTNQRKFESEVSIHLAEPNNLNKLPVLAFTNLLICLDCGFVESRVTDSELREVIEGDIKKSGG